MEWEDKYRAESNFDEDDEIPQLVVHGGTTMNDAPGGGAGSRRNEDIALDMMKFIAMTTGFGKTGTPGAGFQGGTVARPEQYADHLLELYGKCLAAVAGKK